MDLHISKNVIIGTTTVATSIFGYELYKNYPEIKKWIWKNFIKIPIVKKKVDKKIEVALSEIKKNVLTPISDTPDFLQLPSVGLEKDFIVDLADKYNNKKDFDWKKGYVSGTVYKDDEEYTNFLCEIYKKFSWTNPLHPDTFPSIRKMEAEIVNMCIDLYKGDENCCGTTTSGGTESIMLACKAYRDYAEKRGIEKPEMIITDTAHAAFWKAADYFKIKVVEVGYDFTRDSHHVGYCLNNNELKKVINKNTCMIGLSAPNFTYGSFDNVHEVQELLKTLSFDIPIHLDCCLGGFILPFTFEGQNRNFNRELITSISLDTHKYGYGPKGCSVILYRDKKYCHNQYFIQPDWSGGIYASPTFAGSRSGAIIAATWAALLYHGKEGYNNYAKKIVNTTREIANELKKIDGIKVIGEPSSCIVAFKSKVLDIYRLAENLKLKKWNLNILQNPPAVHLCVTTHHLDKKVINKFIEDVKNEVEKILNEPNASTTGVAAIYGMSQQLPDKSIVKELAYGYLDTFYKVI